MSPDFFEKVEAALRRAEFKLVTERAANNDTGNIKLFPNRSVH